MNKSIIPAIVFGGGINGLGVVRNLGRNGLPVFCVVEKPEQVIYSKFCKKYYIVPKIEKSLDVLRNFLRSTDFKPAVFFPASDLFSLHLSELKEELKNKYFLPFSKVDIIKKLVDKKEFYQSLSSFDIPHPKTLMPNSPKDVIKLQNELQFPIFIKPFNSQEFEFKFKKKGFLANSKDELITYYLYALKNNFKVMFQEVIAGTAANIFGIEGYFDKKSNPLGLFAYRRLRGFPPKFGNTCLRESVSISKLNPQVKATISYLQKIKFQGLMEAEWKWDPKSRFFKLLEINARQSMQNSLPSRCGINLILIAYLNAIGKKIKPISSYKEGEKWINFIQDLVSASISATPLINWIRSLNNIREFSYFAADDYYPWIVSNFETIKELSRRVFNKIND